MSAPRLPMVVPPPTKPLHPPADFPERAAALGIEFEPGDVEKLGLYLALLLHANESFNLTAVRDPADAWTRHILDSLTLLALLAELPEGSRVMDVGSGGGVPGIPLAITLPALKFTLLEATGKKVEFLNDAVTRLGLKHVTVVQGRAEAVGHDRGEKVKSGRQGGHREAYEAVVCRAVGRIAVVAELCVPFCAIGGRVLLIKGQAAEEELAEGEAALRTLNAVPAGVVETPTGRIVVLEKRSATPKVYPRADGEPKRAPLGILKERGGRGGTRRGEEGKKDAR